MKNNLLRVNLWSNHCKQYKEKAPGQFSLSGRMTSWTRTVCFCAQPDNFICIQQVKALCTFAFVLPEQRFKRPLRLQSSVEQESCSTRHYNWRGRDNQNIDAFPLFRSRTAYYDILKVTPHATQAQIKTAYYKQSFIYHPDKNPGNMEATQAFSEISEAYTVLGNISLRKKYDRGILSESDVRGAGKPSKASSSSSSSSSSKQMGSTQQQRSRQYTQRGEKVFYDFDAFYKAHYGEQLQREQEMKARKQRIQEMQERKNKEWQHRKLLEILATMLCASAGLILYNIKNS